MRRILLLSTIALLLASSCSDSAARDQKVTPSPDAGDVSENDVTHLDTSHESDTSGDASEADTSEALPLAAVDDYFAVEQGERVRKFVQNNDGGHGPVQVEIVGAPSRGVASIVEDGALEFEAPARFNGYVTIEYRVTDSQGSTDEATAFFGVFETLPDGGVDQPVMVDFPRSGIEPDEIAVVINTDDPVSVSIGEYYAAQRNLPEENVIRVAVPTDSNTIDRETFEPIRQQIEQATPEGTQAYALTWIKPYRVECMSITSAVALGGFDEKYCSDRSSGTCASTAPVDYFNSESTRPFDDHDIRPTMVLGAVDETYGKELVDRGIAADASFPTGRGHLVRTTDNARSVRWSDFVNISTEWAENGEFEVIYTDDSNTIENDTDALFYFTGLTSVDGLDTNTYLPGAVADHLTSYGGRLTSTSGQMSALRWLEAGVTGSYGTVVEPCNYTTKFPKVSTFLSHYFRGQSLVEAYWKSVRWPGEGIFVGDPAARPWGRHFLHLEDGTLTIETTMLEPNATYELVGADTLDSPMEVVLGDISVEQHRRAEIVVDAPAHRFLKLRRVE